jgi:hypothetical protein
VFLIHRQTKLTFNISCDSFSSSPSSFACQNKTHTFPCVDLGRCRDANGNRPPCFCEALCECHPEPSLRPSLNSAPTYPSFRHHRNARSPSHFSQNLASLLCRAATSCPANVPLGCRNLATEGEQSPPARAQCPKQIRLHVQKRRAAV